jgi:type I restriction enzyme S subunit
MQQKKHTYLRFVRYKDLNLWDVKRFWGDLDLLFSSSVRLKDILSPHFEPVSKEEMLNKQWHIISKINFAGKLFLRDVSEAKTFKGNLNKIDSNTLIYSKINVKHGCIYFHPDNAEPFGVSSEYPAYKIDASKVSGAYLVKVIQSQYFKTLLNQKTSGISKARVKPYEFLDIKIPLPSLSEQQALIKAYNDKIQQAETLEKQAEQIGKDIDAYLNDELGISQSESSDEQNIVNEYKFLRFVNFKYLREWGFNKIINHKKNLSCLNNDANGYKTTQLSDIISLKSGLFLPKDKQNGTLYDVYGGNGITGTHNEYCFSGKRVVIGRVGEYCGNIHLVDGNYWVTDNALIVDQKSDNITWEYLAIALKLLNLNQYKNISAQPVISQKKILVLSIPLPSIDIQNVIVKHINKQKEQIKQLKQQAENLKKEALEEFEKEVFE